ncbi:alpha/beta hydrolase [Pyxidicoccus xibeiensis]|uniref:alpha/beta hydrolase n=1 Tax=Pyxidicoccus xibeiensis TaxID=2906759 RepID=UPI0020A77180|nr:alpha/beta hydrolase [Pyxidicoccus xibeiensis]MCP3139415.1 alpha/beta hydrolase [Pyxidicoccus xibeiensis]
MPLPTPTKTVMLIHGAWLTPLSWEAVRARYEARGFKVIAPAWPYLDRTVEELRANLDPRFAKLNLADIINHYDALIRALPEKPILIGHSFGGLIVQVLLDRGLGAAGVAVDPGPPFGVPAHPKAVWTSRSVFTAWNAWNRALTMSFDGFRAGFANTLPESEMRAAYDKYIVPTPGRIFFQAVLGKGSKITTPNPARAPLLLTAAEFDNTIPLPMVKANAKKQAKSPSKTEFKMFPNRSHTLLLERGWEEVADFILDWAIDATRAPVPIAVAKAADVQAPRLNAAS